jgi:FAD-dependent oxidoreductase domain-containing protein 1
MLTKDVVIVGGGIIGSSIAYFLKRQSSATVVVVEQDPSYRGSSTARSAAAIRQQFNLGINVAMSAFTYEFFRNAAEHLSVDGEAVDLEFAECPYLIVTAAEGVERLASAHARQIEAGAQVELLGAGKLAESIAWLKADGLAAGCLGLRGEGWLNSVLALQALVRKAKSLGVEYITGSVAAMERNSSQIRQVITAEGAALKAGAFVNAAGAKAATVAAMAGVHLPIESRKRSAFVLAARKPPQGFTNLIDPTFMQRGVYARPYGSNFLAVTSPDPAEDPATESYEVDHYLFEQVIRPALARRVRGFEEVELVDAWAGHYEMNCFDQNAILGPHPELTNFFLACGLSGHGVMHSAAIGRGIAEHLLTGNYRTLDLTPFGYDRILQKRPLDDAQASEHRTSRFNYGLARPVS